MWRSFDGARGAEKLGNVTSRDHTVWGRAMSSAHHGTGTSSGAYDLLSGCNTVYPSPLFLSLSLLVQSLLLSAVLSFSLDHTLNNVATHRHRRASETVAI